MFVNTSVFLCLCITLVMPSYSAAFFLNWGPSENVPVPNNQYYYHQRLLQRPATYVQEPSSAESSPQLPTVQVPLRAQWMNSNLQNVQLVPCLCPVTQDIEVEKPPQERTIY